MMRWTAVKTNLLIEKRMAEDESFSHRINANKAWQKIWLCLKELEGTDDLSIIQVKRRWNNLCTKYKDIKDYRDEHCWPYFKQMNAFFSKKNKCIPVGEQVDEEKKYKSILEDKLSLCRLCQKFKSVHSLQDDEEQCKLITDFTSIELLDDECLPLGICSFCKTTINTFYKSVLQWRFTDRQLRESISSLNTQIAEAKSSEIKNIQVYECSDCPALLSTQNEYEKHLESHHKFYCYKCSECDQSFRRPCRLREHKKIHEPQNAQNSAAVKTSTEENHGNVDKEIQELCEEYTNKNAAVFSGNISTKTFTRRHVDNHVGATYKCPHKNCGKSFTNLTSIRMHERRHLKHKSFLCFLCGKGFTTNVALQSHEKGHLEIRDHVCHICNRAFTIKANLKMHNKKHHEGLKFYCAKCPKAYLTNNSLSRHELTHTGNKTFTCDVCNKGFYLKKELLRHKKYHEGTKSHQCKVCYKDFYEAHGLKVHLRRHTGERPYVCKVSDCGKSFVDSSKLTRHMKIHTLM